MKKNIKQRLKEQVKKLPREELEKRYLTLLFSTYNTTAKRSGVLGSIISEKKKDIPANTRKEQYHQDLEHPLWLKKRNVILERDQHQCRICGSNHNLQVHHVKYSPGKRAWEYPNLDLITLCKDCHEKVHQDFNHELNPYKNKKK